MHLTAYSQIKVIKKINTKKLSILAYFATSLPPQDDSQEFLGESGLSSFTSRDPQDKPSAFPLLAPLRCTNIRQYGLTTKAHQVSWEFEFSFAAARPRVDDQSGSQMTGQKDRHERTWEPTQWPNILFQWLNTLSPWAVAFGLHRR